MKKVATIGCFALGKQLEKLYLQQYQDGGTIISNDVSIGDDVIIVLGNVVTRSIQSRQIVIGNIVKVVKNLRLT
jgi:hypothetical protein